VTRRQGSKDGQFTDGTDDGASALSVSADLSEPGAGAAEGTEAAHQRRTSMYGGGDARRLSAHHEAVRGAPPPPPPPPSAKEDLRKAVELHREQETRLKAATRAAQVSIGVLECVRSAQTRKIVRETQLTNDGCSALNRGSWYHHVLVKGRDEICFIGDVVFTEALECHLGTHGCSASSKPADCWSRNFLDEDCDEGD
jgi:hypothetical protein